MNNKHQSLFNIIWIILHSLLQGNTLNSKPECSYRGMHFHYIPGFVAHKRHSVGRVERNLSIGKISLRYRELHLNKVLQLGSDLIVTFF